VFLLDDVFEYDPLEDVLSGLREDVLLEV